MNPLLILALIAALTPPAVDTVAGDTIVPDSPLYGVSNLGEDMKMAVGLKSNEDAYEKHVKLLEQMDKENRSVGLTNAYNRLEIIQQRIADKIETGNLSDEKIAQLEKLSGVLERNQAKIGNITARHEELRKHRENNDTIRNENKTKEEKDIEIAVDEKVREFQNKTFELRDKINAAREHRENRKQ